jgi:diaminohydroxyphosphoribosylaminopyrimidine deaminase / 5-amino-6-(5-phosphoribosylamino)uracil reductase
MTRCLQLAQYGAGRVAPNPMVGAVLVHEGRVIGEGWHQRYGGPHAEVQCIASVSTQDRALIPFSTLYCSLEPCNHFGKTPPCTDLVLQERIPEVVVCNTDPNPLVAGSGLERLRAAGVRVETGLLEAEGLWLNRVFFTWITRKRPYIILKWAQSSDGRMGRPGERTPVSDPPVLRYVHRLRSETDAILVGGQTALTDNPRLDNRFFPLGPAPLRIAYDRAGQLPTTHHLLDDSTETWLVSPERPGRFTQTLFMEDGTIGGLLHRLQEAKRSSLLVEGGADTHRRWLEAGQWDEIQIIQNHRVLGTGIPAPKVPDGAIFVKFMPFGMDTVSIYRSAAVTQH